MTEDEIMKALLDTPTFQECNYSKTDFRSVNDLLKEDKGNVDPVILSAAIMINGTTEKYAVKQIYLKVMDTLKKNKGER